MTTKSAEHSVAHGRYGKGSILPDRDPAKDNTANDRKLADLLMEMAKSPSCDTQSVHRQSYPWG